jgi:HK97 family phage major capsid protein
VNLHEKRASEMAAAQAIVDGAKSALRGLTDDERATIEGHFKSVDELDVQIKTAEADQALLKRIGTIDPAAAAVEDAPTEGAKSLGEHFVKHAGAQLKAMKGVNGASVSAPEFKAATTTHTVGSVFTNPVLTQFDRTIIQGVRPRLTIADLLGSGAIGANNNAVSYFVEGALEGAFTTVAEGGAKPQLHVVDPTIVTDSLKKIAGFIKLTDEMTEDLDFFVSEINNRLLYELAKFEEASLLSGAGTGSTVQGLLNRSGIQTLGAGTDLKVNNADQVFKAMTLVSTGAGLDADGIVINPADYQNFRLMKDANNQYYGGGFFLPPYGEAGQTMAASQPLWGLRTVVTPAITAGTVLVGAFQQAATVYRKGGVRVESTNSHVDDFTNNLVTVRAEERVALAVRRPAGLVKLTLGTA